MSERILTCVYCGHQYPQDTPAWGHAVLTAHIAQCKEHPMRAVIEERDRLLEERANLAMLVSRLARRLRAARDGRGSAAGDADAIDKAIGYLKSKGLFSVLRGPSGGGE